MRTIIIAALLFWVCDTYAADWITFTANSYHFSRRDYNETNHGLGYEHDLSAQWKSQIGFYKNSFYRESVYAGFTYLPLQLNSFRFGVAGQYVSGYEKKPVPLLLPMLEWESSQWPVGVNVLLLPSVVGVQFKWRLE